MVFTQQLSRFISRACGCDRVSFAEKQADGNTRTMVGNYDPHHQLCFIEHLILIFAAALLCWLDGVRVRVRKVDTVIAAAIIAICSPHVGLARMAPEENARTSLGAGITLVLERWPDNSPWISHCREVIILSSSAVGGAVARVINTCIGGASCIDPRAWCTK